MYAADAEQAVGELQCIAARVSRREHERQQLVFAEAAAPIRASFSRGAVRTVQHLSSILSSYAL
jgi:hypothetical protein